MGNLTDRRVTNLDRNGKHKKSVWFEDTAQERTEPAYKGAEETRPSRYGPDREYVANCTSVNAADHLVYLWNYYIEHSWEMAYAAYTEQQKWKD